MTGGAGGARGQTCPNGRKVRGVGGADVPANLVEEVR